MDAAARARPSHLGLRTVRNLTLAQWPVRRLMLAMRSLWRRSHRGESDLPVSVKLPKGTKVDSVAAGSIHSLALTTTGSMLAWGSNDVGQLGWGKLARSSVPIKVKLPNHTNVVAVAAGTSSGLALTSTGSVLAWGDNQTGTLDDGTATGPQNCSRGKRPIPYSRTPVKVKLPSGDTATAIGAGAEAEHTLTLVR